MFTQQKAIERGLPQNAWRIVEVLDYGTESTGVDEAWKLESEWPPHTVAYLCFEIDPQFDRPKRRKGEGVWAVRICKDNVGNCVQTVPIRTHWKDNLPWLFATLNELRSTPSKPTEPPSCDPVQEAAPPEPDRVVVYSRLRYALPRGYRFACKNADLKPVFSNRSSRTVFLSVTYLDRQDYLKKTRDRMLAAGQYKLLRFGHRPDYSPYLRGDTREPWSGTEDPVVVDVTVYPIADLVARDFGVTSATVTHALSDTLTRMIPGGFPCPTFTLSMTLEQESRLFVFKHSVGERSPSTMESVGIV